jgi:hypothetical protein
MNGSPESEGKNAEMSRALQARGTLGALEEHRSPSSCCPGDAAERSPCDLEPGHYSNEIEEKRCLAGDGRRTNKQSGLTLTSDGDGLGCLGEGAQMNQHDDGWRCGDRYCRMHHDAQLAMVGVSSALVQVRNLRK